MQIRVRLKLLRDAALVYACNNPEAALDGFVPATPLSVGVDLRACLEPGEEEVSIAPGERRAVGSGIALEPLLDNDELVAGFVYSRSGLGAKQGLVVAQGVGIIDPDYRGEIIVWLLNTSQQEIRLQRGERMAQLLFMPCCRPVFELADELSQTRRGAGGFGHTGK